MAAARFALVLLVALGIGVCFVVPARDLPDTAYDESESLPYEMTPSFCGGLVQESAPTHQVVLIVPSDLFSTPKQALGRTVCREFAAHSICDSLIILDHLLRC